TPSRELLDTINHLVHEHKFTIEKGWKNGYHLILRGRLPDELLPVINVQLNKGIQNSENEYVDEEFIQKYESINHLLGGGKNFLSPIVKAKVTSEKVDHFFHNNLEDNLFIEVNNIFDRYFLDCYFKDNDLYKVIEEIWDFHTQLQKYVEENSPNAYNCHLSHYIAFIHKLNDNDKEKIEYQFNKKFLKDKEHRRFDFKTISTKLTEELLEFYFRIRPLVKKRKLDFYMPHNRAYVDRKIKVASSRHKMTFSKKNMEKHLYNDVLIVNRWVNNALYTKMLLLNFNNLDRFYMNYLISRLIYPISELENY